MNSSSAQRSSSATAATDTLASTSVQAATNEPSPTKVRFLSMDIKSSDGVAKIVPYVDKENAKKMIPVHIRAASDNPRAALLAMEQYRQMSGAQQQKEHDLWKGFSPAEQRRFKVVLSNLDQLKAKLIAGSVSWEEVAPSIESMLKNAPRAARKRSAVDSDQTKKKRKLNKGLQGPQTDTTQYWLEPWTKQKTSREVSARSTWRSQSTTRQAPLDRTSASVSTNTQASCQVQSSARATATAPQPNEGSRGGATTRRPPRLTNSRRRIMNHTTPPPNANTNIDTAIVSREPTGGAAGSASADDDDSYVGWASSEAARIKEANNKRRQASSRQRRKKGTFTKRCYHQGDAISLGAALEAHKAVAIASDTTYYTNRNADEPEHCLLLLEYNGFIDPSIDGGRPPDDSTKVKRKKPLVVASGVHDNEQMVRILQNSIAALKHKNRDPKNHDVVRLYREDSNTLLAQKVERYCQQKLKLVRNRP